MNTEDASTAPVELTILMPCLNEARTVAACVAEAAEFLKRAGVNGEVLISDNGSTDGSQDLARAAGARVIDAPQRGYGAALQAGISAARGRFVVMGDADQSYNFGRLDAFLDRLRAGADLVMGNRFRGGIHPGAMPPLHRYLGNPVLSFIGRLFFRTPIGDFHCGLRGFSRDAVLRLGLVSPGMEFASEMVAKAALGGLLIEEVPTELRPDGRGRPPHLRTWRDGWRHLRFLMLYCPRWLFLYPGLCMLALGGLGQLLISADVVRIGRAGLGIHSMLYLAGLIVLGSQFVQFAVLTRWMGMLAGVAPPQPWIVRWTRMMNLEACLVVCAVLFGIGLASSARLLGLWGQAAFGPMDPQSTMRAAIPAVTLMILGVQLAAGALFGSALNALWRARGPHGQLA